METMFRHLTMARPARQRMINGDDMDMPRTSFCLMAAIVTVARVETWSKAHWEAAKKEWAKDTTKWANCQRQWNKHKHEGRKSWPSVYKCMTS
jgi:hypothetical protein